MDSIIYFLPMLLFLGIVTSYEDIKENKIRNKWILLSLVYAMLTNALLLIAGKIDLTYIFYLSVNGIICLLAGLLLWYVNFWTAGDAKLFFAYALLIPLNYYASGYIGYAPSITILINLFFVVMLYLGFVIFSKINKKRLIKLIKNKNKIKDSIYSLFFIFGLTWVISSVLNIFNIRDILISFVLSFFAFIAIRYLLGELIFEFGLILTLLRVVFDKNVFSPGTLILVAYVFLFWLVFIKFLFELSDFAFTREIKINKLKEGMTLAKTIEGKSKSGKWIIKMETTLSKKDIGWLKSTKKQSNFYCVPIRQTMAFAPFLFIGVIITILAKGNILIVLRHLI